MALKVLHFLKTPWKRQIFGSEILVEKLHAYSSEYPTEQKPQKNEICSFEDI